MTKLERKRTKARRKHIKLKQNVRRLQLAIRTFMDNEKRENAKKLQRRIRFAVGQLTTLSTHDLYKIAKMMSNDQWQIALRVCNSEEDQRISEDDCDFDFDNSTRPLCSTSEDDSDGPQGSYKSQGS